MSETVGEWKAHKQAQADYFMKRDPSLRLETLDYGTKFILVHDGLETAMVIGQLRRDDAGQPRIDLTSFEIEEWASGLRKAA